MGGISERRLRNGHEDRGRQNARSPLPADRAALSHEGVFPPTPGTCQPRFRARQADREFTRGERCRVAVLESTKQRKEDHSQQASQPQNMTRTRPAPQMGLGNAVLRTGRTHTCIPLTRTIRNGQAHRNGGGWGGRGRGPTETANSCGLPLGDGKVLEYESRDRCTTLNTGKPTELHTSKGHVSSSSIKLFWEMLGSLPIKAARKHKPKE